MWNQKRKVYERGDERSARKAAARERVRQWRASDERDQRRRRRATEGERERTAQLPITPEQTNTFDSTRDDERCRGQQHEGQEQTDGACDDRRDRTARDARRRRRLVGSHRGFARNAGAP